MTRKFYHAEQTGNIVTFFDSAGQETCLQSDLEAYIEANRLNTHTIQDLDAKFEEKEVEFQSASDYLDDNWDSITLKYWSEKFNKS